MNDDIAKFMQSNIEQNADFKINKGESDLENENGSKLGFWKSIKKILRTPLGTGRLSPKQAWKMFGILIPVFILGCFVLMLAFQNGSRDPNVFLLILGFIIELYALLNISLFIPIKRLHDMGYSGWWILLISIVTNLLGKTGIFAIETSREGEYFNGFFFIVFVLLYSLPANEFENQYGKRLDW